MLSLKSFPPKKSLPRITSIYDLPAELFDAIIEQCVSHLPITVALPPVSLVSRRFRQAAIAILFRCVNITLSDAQRRHGGTLLDFLLHKPHIRRCVRMVRLCGVAGEIARQEAEYQKLGEVLPLLSGLQDIELDYFFDQSIDLLRLIGSLKMRPRVAIKDLSLEELSDAHREDTVEALRSLSNIKSLGFRGAVPSLASRSQDAPILENVRGIMATCRSLDTLSLVGQPERAIPARHDFFGRPEYKCNGDNTNCLPPLKELQLNVLLGVSKRSEENCLSLLTGFQWQSIEKLAITSERLIDVLLPRFGAEMTSLHSLRISALPPPVHGAWATSEQSLLAVSEFLATRPLVELELDGFCKSLPMRLVASGKLRKLRLHMWEMDHVTAQANLRSAQDVRELADLAPNLEHLMLDVAHVGKLWHPSAIPGVDIDVHLYQLLDALTKFRRLKTLHLFPRYYKPDGNGRGFWQQAIEDDGQAVRIFKHLKSMQPSLELLILSSDNVIARSADIDPMSWTVCQLGDKILLRVRQANKDYEQKQIWHGERRLRTEIKRYSYSKPYLDGVGPRLSRRRRLS